MCKRIQSTTRARNFKWMRWWWTLTEMACWYRMDTRTFWWVCHRLFCRLTIRRTSRSRKIQKLMASSLPNSTSLALTRTTQFLKVSSQISLSSRSWRSQVWSTQGPPKASKEWWKNQPPEMSSRIKEIMAPTRNSRRTRLVRALWTWIKIREKKVAPCLRIAKSCSWGPINIR